MGLIGTLSENEGNSSARSVRYIVLSYTTKLGGVISDVKSTFSQSTTSQRAICLRVGIWGLFVGGKNIMSWAIVSILVVNNVCVEYLVLNERLHSAYLHNKWALSSHFSPPLEQFHPFEGSSHLLPWSLEQRILTQTNPTSFIPLLNIIYYTLVSLFYC